ncbi:MAG: ABC transporter permease [Firmicutes bacterium]|nr:ABC transporter permease [Bacillota bacterium]
MRLLRYSLRRLLLIVPVLLGVTFIAFMLTRIVPGNPIERVAGPYASKEKVAEMKAAAHLDKPYHTQFYIYVRDLVTTGSLGDSYFSAQPVAKDLRERFGASFELAFLGMLVAIVLSIPLGVASAAYRDSWVDQLGRIISVLGVSMPIFWLGLVLLQVFFVRLNWLPAPMGRIDTMLSAPPPVTGLDLVDSALTGDWAVFKDVVQHLVLPVFIIAFTAMAPLARITRSSMIEALESDYVRTARALGLPRRLIIFDHALKNAMLPVITMVAAVFGYILGGEVLVELVFSWPGLGLYAYNAILAADFPAIQGFILLVTFMYVVLYLIVDLLIAILDPRVEF